MADHWFVQRDGQTFGPFGPAQLKQMTATGQLLPVDLVSRGGDDRWIPASQITGLFPAPAKQQPAPAPAATGPLPPAPDSDFDFAGPPAPTASRSGRNRGNRGRSGSWWMAVGSLAVILGGVSVFLITRGSRTAPHAPGPNVAATKSRPSAGRDGSWAEKAFALSGEKKDPSFKPAPAGSLQDFFDAVNVLSVRVGDVPIRSGAKVPCHFAAPGCPATLWHGIFGEPEVLSKGRERIGRVENEFDRWRVRCVDGSVTVHGKIQGVGGKTYYYPTMILVD
jgi:hypothetical protein